MRQRSGTPSSSCSPASSKTSPLPATRSFTVWDTSTCEAPAFAPTLAPKFTAIPPDLSVDRVHLAGVHSGADLDPKGSHRLDEGLCAPDCPGRTVERREEPVACCVDLVPAVAGKQRPRCRVVPLEQVSPGSVTERCGAFRGPNDVGEQDRRQHSVELRLFRAHRRNEAFDLFDHGVDRSEEGRMIDTVEFGHLRSWDPARDVADLLEVPHPIAPPVHHERGHSDGWEHRPGIGLVVHRIHRTNRTRTRAGAEVPGQSVHEHVIRCVARPGRRQVPSRERR
jgi:hypothetical protein